MSLGVSCRAFLYGRNDAGVNESVTVCLPKKNSAAKFDVLNLPFKHPRTDCAWPEPQNFGCLCDTKQLRFFDHNDHLNPSFPLELLAYLLL
jgi:hypothetical protein